MTKLRRTTGETTTNQSEILQEQVTYYKNLYNQSPTIDDTGEATSRFMLNEDMPTLDENDAATCEGKVTLEETSSALIKMKNGSASGYDGITTEFVKFFWSTTGVLVTNSFTESFGREELSFTQKQGVITQLHKGSELDKEDLKSWRPITLTNTHYKILAKVLAERLSEVIPKLVSEDFQKWVSVLTKGTASCINHGGWVSEPFEMLYGIRQGCPFSPLAFVLAVELLDINVRNSTIAGVETPNLGSRAGAKYKIKQLADDATLFLKR